MIPEIKNFPRFRVLFALFGVVYAGVLVFLPAWRLDLPRVWVFLAYSDTGHIKYKLGTSAQTTKELDGGIFYADSKYDPMIVYHANDAAAAGSIDYITVDYINK